jgi:hypothetical protein
MAHEKKSLATPAIDHKNALLCNYQKVLRAYESLNPALVLSIKLTKQPTKCRF